jgi:DNA-directed RNA polymerase subunit F
MEIYGIYGFGYGISHYISSWDVKRILYDYVYLLENETVYGMKNKLKHLHSFSDEELAKKGKQAKQFVLNNKNNLIQAGRILDLCLR